MDNFFSFGVFCPSLNPSIILLPINSLTDHKSSMRVFFFVKIVFFYFLFFKNKMVFFISNVVH